LDEWNSVIAPLFKMGKNEGWGSKAIRVGAKGLGRAGLEAWYGQGYGQVDGSPFPFNWGKKSKKIPWIATIATPRYDDAAACLLVGFASDLEYYPDAVADHSLYDDRCQYSAWFLCEF
jgi:hypothetical protein